MVRLLKTMSLLLLLASAAYAVPGRTGQLRVYLSAQGTDGTCDFGYDTSNVNALDTFSKYIDYIGPFGDQGCSEIANTMRANNPELLLSVYFSVTDIWPTYDTVWGDSSDLACGCADFNPSVNSNKAFEKTRLTGWLKNYLATTHSWTVDQREKLYLHFYDTTTFYSSGQLFSIPGCYKDSSAITAADSVSRVPNGYANSQSYWSGNTYTMPTRLQPNHTNKFVREAYGEYLIQAYTDNEGGNGKPFPGKNHPYDNIFLDNVAVHGLGLNIVTGGHVVESYDLSNGAILDSVWVGDTTMMVVSGTAGSFLLSVSSGYDNWRWDECINPFIKSFDTLIDTIVMSNGARPRYLLNPGYQDWASHYHTDTQMAHDNYIEWSGATGRGISNTVFTASAGEFAGCFDTIVTRDSIAVAKGNVRLLASRGLIGNFAGAIDPSAGGGTQNFHEAWLNTYILMMVLNGDSSYYDFFHWFGGSTYRAGWYPDSRNPAAGTAGMDSLKFGSQGAFNLRSLMNQEFGAKSSSQPFLYATGTADGDSYEIQARRYGGNVNYPNGFLFLFRPRSNVSSEFMSNSTHATVVLDTTYELWGDGYSNSITDTLDAYSDTLTGTNLSTVYLRAGEGVILYQSEATDDAPTISAFSMTGIQDTICTNETRTFTWTITDDYSLDSIYIRHNATTLFSAQVTGASSVRLLKSGLNETFSSTVEPGDSITMFALDTAGNLATKTINSSFLIPVTLQGSCAANIAPTISIAAPVGTAGDSVCAAGTTVFTVTLFDESDLDSLSITYAGLAVADVAFTGTDGDTVYTVSWTTPDTAITTPYPLIGWIWDNVGDSAVDSTITMQVRVCPPDADVIFRIGGR